MSTLNICFYGDISQIIPKLSSNTILICSTVNEFSNLLSSYKLGLRRSQGFLDIELKLLDLKNTA